ncbi:olfactory receptor 7E24-like [Mesocricetus auratus]|uniref:Olfactory receptor 7E24-like n=1 Tax=Mesocricetus auratus TaxID=10036 RepID=A0A1U7QEK7_MESAU|nr:olfactory receptor 7E24-like [Mesocricetus auratus]
MKGENLTCAWEFLLLGLSEDSEIKPILFGLFLSMYLVTVLGNLLIILAVSSDSNLQTPMYFFLCNLSLADIGFSSTTIPKILMNIQTHSKSITYAGCLMQVSSFFFFGCLDSLLLTVMAYDRLLAICFPLHYAAIMHPRLCVFLSLSSLSISLLDSQLHFLIVSQLTFCRVVKIPHFFCDPAQLLSLACSNTSNNKIFIYIFGIIFGGVPVSVILYSYKRIVSSILRISSKDGKSKAFSTCGTHLSVVCLFYGTAFGAYFSSAASHSPRKTAVATVMYTMVTPMLNPFIYSLRNRDIKWALWRLSSRRL